jgi:cytochrome c oxidase subunit 4
MTALRPALTTFAALILLLAITAASSRIDLGWGNAAINIAIAVLKALLILLVFMQLRANRGLPRLAAGVAALWLGILYVLTFADYATR